MERRSEKYLLGGFFELVVTALLCVEVGKGGVPKYLATLAALDTLARYKISARNMTRRGGRAKSAAPLHQPGQLRDLRLLALDLHHPQKGQTRDRGWDSPRSR